MFGERLPPAALSTTARALLERTSPFPTPTFSPSRDLSSPPLTEPAVLAPAPHPTPPPPRTRASSPFHLTVLRHLSAGAFSLLPHKTKGTVHDRILDKPHTVSRKAQTHSRQICTAAAFPPPAKARPRFWLGVAGAPRALAPAPSFTTNKRASGLSATVRPRPPSRGGSLHPGPRRKDARLRRGRLSEARREL